MQVKYKGFTIRMQGNQWWIINRFHELVEYGFKTVDDAKRWLDEQRY